MKMVLCNLSGIKYDHLKVVNGIPVVFGVLSEPVVGKNPVPPLIIS